jgi:hypothetical protein
LPIEKTAVVVMDYTLNLKNAIHEELEYFPPIILERGLNVYHGNKIHRVERNENMSAVWFTIQSQNNNGNYFTHLSLNPLTRQLEVDCNCPYGESNCKHVAAAFYFLIDYFNGASSKNATGLIVPDLSLGSLKAIFNAIPKKPNLKRDSLKPEIVATAPGKFEVTDIESGYKTDVRQDKGNTLLNFACSCGSKNPCAHLYKALHFVGKKYGPDAFPESYDWQKERNDILGHYGFVAGDDYQHYISFSFSNAKIDYKLLNEGLSPSNKIFDNSLYFDGNPDCGLPKQHSEKRVAGYVFVSENSWSGPKPLKIIPVLGKPSKNTGHIISKLEVVQNIKQQEEWFELVDNKDILALSFINKYNSRKFPPTDKNELLNYFTNQEKIFGLLQNKPFYKSTKRLDYLSVRDISPISADIAKVFAKFYFLAEDDIVHGSLSFFLEGKEIKIENSFFSYYNLIEHGEKVYQWNSYYEPCF